jgi:flavin reductase (DIM6/NTAB) family NADH-FMN oxidoreductase RutF
MDMEKREMGPQHLLNPKPVVLVGTVVDEKPNFITVSWIGSASADPPAIAVAIRSVRYSLRGIREHRTFSVNLPSVDMVGVADYCGSVSGATVDKVTACNFSLFSGGLKCAPMIAQCPVNMECEVLQFVEVGNHSLIVGSIRETYVTEDCCVKGIPDIEKIQPLCYCALAPASSGYYSLGKFLSGTASEAISK